MTNKLDYFMEMGTAFPHDICYCMTQQGAPRCQRTDCQRHQDHAPTGVITMSVLSPHCSSFVPAEDDSWK